MATTPNYNFFKVVGTTHTKSGVIVLTYTLNNDGTITAATFTYTDDATGTAQGPYPVDFGTGTTTPYTGSCNMTPPAYTPLNIGGAYKSGTMTFDTTSGVTYPLSGTFSASPAGIAADPADLNWDAGTGVGVPGEAKKAAGK